MSTPARRWVLADRPDGVHRGGKDNVWPAAIGFVWFGRCLWGEFSDAIAAQSTVTG
jgi:hypothetical protein